MRELLTATAAAAMMFGASAAYAQNATTQFYVTGEGDEMRVMGRNNTQGAVVVGDETYAMPADCPDGAYWRSGPNMLTACGEGGSSFNVAVPEAGAAMASGERVPEGAMILTPRDNGDTRQDTTNQGASVDTNSGGPNNSGASGSSSNNSGSTGTTGSSAGGASGVSGNSN